MLSTADARRSAAITYRIWRMSLLCRSCI